MRPIPLAVWELSWRLNLPRLGAGAVLEAMNSNRKAVNSNVAFAEYDAAMRAHAQEHHKAAAFHYGRQESRSAGPSGE